jgi:hypothetical protein
MDGTRQEIEAVLDSNGYIPSQQGGAILQELYGPHKSSILFTMLDDPYFDELVL